MRINPPTSFSGTNGVEPHSDPRIDELKAAIEGGDKDAAYYDQSNGGRSLDKVQKLTELLSDRSFIKNLPLEKKREMFDCSVIHDNVTALKLLMLEDEYREFIEGGMDDSPPALHLAVEHCHADAAIALMEFGANLDSIYPDRGGVTPLMMAVHPQRVQSTRKIVDELIFRGADVSAEDFANQTALDYLKKTDDTFDLRSVLRKGEVENKYVRKEMEKARLAGIEYVRFIPDDVQDRASNAVKFGRTADENRWTFAAHWLEQDLIESGRDSVIAPALLQPKNEKIAVKVFAHMAHDGLSDYSKFMERPEDFNRFFILASRGRDLREIIEAVLPAPHFAAERIEVMKKAMSIVRAEQGGTAAENALEHVLRVWLKGGTQQFHSNCNQPKCIIGTLIGFYVNIPKVYQVHRLITTNSVSLCHI